jgi:hypothetical protein
MAPAMSARLRSLTTATRSPGRTLMQVRTALRAPAAYSDGMTRESTAAHAVAAPHSDSQKPVNQS